MNKPIYQKAPQAKRESAGKKLELNGLEKAEQREDGGGDPNRTGE
jgi:hypothetical protein